MKHIHFEILKISLVASLYICSLLKVRLNIYFLNHETKNKCKRITRPWKSTNLYCVHKLLTMKWKYTQLSHHLLLINSMILRHGVDKCVCMSYRWFKTMVEYGFILCTKYTFYLYTQNKNYPTRLSTPKLYLSP